MKQITLLLCFLSLLITPVLLAGDGGSGYSRYGIGDIRYMFSERAFGMANSGLASFSQSSIDHFNPAALSYVNRTRFTIGGLFEGYNTTDGTNSAFLSGTDFGGLMLAFPIYAPSGVVFSAGIAPYSSVNYDIKATSTFGGLLYNVRYSGEGGISEGYLSFSFAPNKDFSFGAKYSYYFGTMRHSVAQSFSSGDYSSASETRSMEAHGSGASLGIIYSGLSRVFHLDSTNQFNVGVVLATNTNLKASEEDYFAYMYSSTQSTIRDTVIVPTSSFSIPLRLGFGATYTTSEYLLASDLVFQDWSAFKGTGVIIGSFRNSYRFSLGGEIFPRRDGAASFFQRLTYRAGFFHDASYYSINGENINETGFTGGFDIPVIGDTRLNIGLQYSFRGTTDNGLQKDKIFRISFNLSGSERWFVPSEEE